MNNVQKTLSAALVFILTATVPIYAQMSPEELLESAVYKEEIEGELQVAIEIFEQIIADYPQNRPVAARALLHLGLCYEKLGNLKAEAVYQRLIEEFGDQQDMVSEARMRLQRIRYMELAEGIEIIGKGPTYRMALDQNAPYMNPLRARQYDLAPIPIF